MNNKYLIGIVVVILVLVGALFLLSRDGTPGVNEEMPLVSSEVPALTGDDVDEMIVAEDGDPLLEGGETEPEGVVQELPDGDDSQTEEAVVESTPPAPLIVTYTDTGFSPKIIEINSGDTVMFINNSSRGMWVASNMHPTHTLYPEESDSDCLGSSFDACTGVAVGESWSFTFNSTGSWDYHDHMKASRTGTVDVN